jgi:hypothetical protein
MKLTEPLMINWEKEFVVPFRRMLEADYVLGHREGEHADGSVTFAVTFKRIEDIWELAIACFDIYMEQKAKRKK